MTYILYLWAILGPIVTYLIAYRKGEDAGYDRAIDERR